MPSTASARRVARRRTVPASAVATAAVLALTATACGSTEDVADAKPDTSVTELPEGTDIELPEGLPTSLDELKEWKEGEWDDWDPDGWLGDAKAFVNPIIEDLWDPDRMEKAEEPDREVDEEELEEDTGAGSGGDEGVTDPAPAKVDALAVQPSYTGTAKEHGKVFMDTPQGQMVCSATVVQDPANPGASNLVATAGHCVHGGKDKGWYRNVVFVPGYNHRALAAEQLNEAPRSEVIPSGVWWAERAGTTEHWRTSGEESGGKGAQADFAMLEVRPEDGGGTSLEETVGGAVAVDFGLPEVASLGELTARGYPAAAPYDGGRMFGCTDTPGRLTIDPDQPTMYRIGCTMTGGSSGGGWTATTADGTEKLYSVTSIGPLTADWLAGPRLGAEAKKVFDALSG